MINENESQHFPNELFRFFEPRAKKHKQTKCKSAMVNKALNYNIWKWWDNLI